MAQLSRPFQIGLAAVAVLAAAWLLLFNGHHETTGPGSGSSAQVASTPAHTAPPAPKKAQGTAGQATGHGSASSLGGLGHAVEQARGAAHTSETNAKQLSEKSAQASSSETTKTSTTRPAETTAAPSKTKGANTTSTPANTTSTPAGSADPKTAAPSAAGRDTATSEQHRVEAQLAQGKIAVILFWDRKGSEDRVVHSALRAASRDRSLRIAVDDAAPGQVASFGTITRGVQVYGTPTMLFINKHGEAVTLTGLQDEYAIAQAVREARHASS